MMFLPDIRVRSLYPSLSNDFVRVLLFRDSVQLHENIMPFVLHGVLRGDVSGGG